jgi:hypothetical protein
MEKRLQNAREGESFVDFSPTEYDVSIWDRKKWGYGYHSFVRLHKVVVENGEKKLVSRAIRNYLDAPEQSEFFESLTGDRVKTNEMLGRVAKIDPAITQAAIKTMAEAFYNSTPFDRKIIPPSNMTQNIKNEREMDEGLGKIDSWLEVIFELMQQGADKGEVLKKFRGWENAVKDFVDAKNNLEEFKNMSIGEMKMALFEENSQVSGLLERLYETGSNGCGNGSGFSEIERNMVTMTYESMTNLTNGKKVEDDPGLCKCGGDRAHFHCPGIKEGKDCKNKIIVGKGILKCPKCGEGKKC